MYHMKSVSFPDVRVLATPLPPPLGHPAHKSPHENQEQPPDGCFFEKVASSVCKGVRIIMAAVAVVVDDDDVGGQ